MRLVDFVPHHLRYGLTHPIALEGALKLKEITYAHCEGIFSSEFKHGPLSAVHEGYPVLFITAPGGESMMINHVDEVTTRGGRAIALAAENPALRANVHDYLAIPEVDRFLAPHSAHHPCSAHRLPHERRPRHRS
ncbi:MAG: SIS domain-containing protein [Anaerolineae bacterium]|jgi:glucosamine--fructose-6-phosphate aminotransferase (isomerizing)